MDTSVVVVDDEALARDRLTSLIGELPGYRLLASCADADSAMRALRDNVPDVVLLDIAMPGMNGLDLARFVGSLETPPAIIFCTAYDEHALPAFELGAAGYLLKPVREGHLLDALEKARKISRLQLKEVRSNEHDEEGEAQRSFRIESHRGVELIPVASVTHLVADQKYVTLHHEGGEALMETSLKALEADYGEDFLRVHRNTLVNRQRIQGFRRNTEGEAYARIRGTPVEPRISRRHLREVKALLTLE